MPQKRMALRMIKDVIRLKWEAQLAHERIAAALKVSKGVVAKYVALASAAGLDWETVKDWDERQLVARLLPRSAEASPYVAGREWTPEGAVQSQDTDDFVDVSEPPTSEVDEASATSTPATN